MNTNEVDRIFEGIVKECSEDHVGLWVIVWELKNAGVIAESEIFETTLAIVKRLLADGKIVAGNFNTDIDDDFHQWKMPVEEIVARIKSEWSELGRDPNLGEIVWFTSA
jgi:hypothetical protein